MTPKSGAKFIATTFMCEKTLTQLSSTLWSHCYQLRPKSEAIANNLRPNCGVIATFLDKNCDDTTINLDTSCGVIAIFMIKKVETLPQFWRRISEEIYNFLQILGG